MIFAYSSSSFAFEKGDRAELTKDFEVKLKNSKKSRDLDKGKKVKIQSCTGNTCIATYGFYTFEIKKNALKKFERSSRTRTKKKKSSGGLFNLFKKKEKKEKKKEPAKYGKGQASGFKAPICECKRANSGGPCTVASRYGWRKPPKKGASSNHQGEDIRAIAGTPVVAVGSGVIVAARSIGKYGKTIDINHGELTSRYAHLSRYEVTSGWVQQGQIIGYVGDTGNVTGPHLHIEFLKTGTKTKFNPRKFISFNNNDLKKSCNRDIVKQSKATVERQRPARSTRARGIR